MLFFATAVYATDIAVNDNCSLADAIKAANKDEATGGCPAGDGADFITLSANTTLGAALPQITTEITIDGAGYTISGNNRYRIFTVRGGDLTVNELTITKGFGDWGGAIANLNGTLDVLNSTLKANEALEGGAIGNDGILYLSNSMIDSNVAEIGGAVYNENGQIRIANTTFNLNRANGKGGALYFKSGELAANDSTFSYNSASKGGAIYKDEGNVTVTQSVFQGNRSSGSGGAVYNHTNLVVVTDCIFDKNSSDWSGGAIYTQYGGLRINATIFSGNSARREGGAIYVSLAGGSISSSSFLENSAIEIGGAYYNSSGIQTISNSTFMNNSAGDKGGAIFNDSDGHPSTDSKPTLNNVTLVGNSALRGGGIYKTPVAILLMYNSMIAGSMGGGDCFGRLTENIGNFIEDGSCFADLIGDPMLGDLVEPEDGSPPYFPLLPGSPAIDAVECHSEVTTDQIGTARPQGAGCDIGAIEFMGTGD